MSRIIKFLYLSLFFLTPLICTSFNSELFELPKMYFVYAITVAILTAHLINWIQGQTPVFRRTPIDFPLALFLISQTISTIVSIDPHTSIYGYYSRMNGGLISIYCYAILYWVLANYIDDKFRENIINISLISGLLVSTYGILEHFGIDKNSWVQDVMSRVFSTLGQPNWLAAYLCILLPLTLYKYLSSSNLFKQSYYLLLVSSFYLCLLFTKSKSGILAAIVSIAIFFVIYYLNLIKSSPLLVKGVVRGGFVLVLLISLSLLVTNPIKDRLFPTPLVKEGSGEILNITPSEDIRKIVWQGAFDLWKKYPVFGTGVETFAYSYYWVRPVAHNLTSEWEFLYNKAHNEYLNYLATTGTFGFTTYTILIVAIIYQLLKSLLPVPFRASKRDLGRLDLAVLSAFVSILITNSVGFSVVIVSIYFFLFPALSLRITDYELRFTKKSKLFFIPVLLISILLLKSILFSYLGDITYAQGASADDHSDYSTSHQYLATSLYYRPHEPLYLSKIALIESKLAIIASSKKDQKLIDYYTKLAISHTTQAVTLSPVNPNYLKEQAQTYYYLATINKEYFTKSIDSLYQVTQIAPTDPKTFFLIGEFLRSAQVNDEALPYLLKAIELKPNYDHAYFMAGQIYLQDKKYPEAKRMFENTLKYAPTNTDAKDYLTKIR